MSASTRALLEQDYASQPAPLDQQVEQADAQAAGAAGQGSIADQLAAASDRVAERLGYEYSEALDMYYCGSNGLYYDQVRGLSL